ncbi:Plasmodium exported protein, unknown function [Plasmodium knowlesi strain H]|uniref:Uncharacterized protein n=3 Tax=Plasmodium knowlesi TaxID=5850 RepID=A0A5E7WYB2_PLAKH|nr:Plasmodium exported protein, unknown function [Plasmodium knowlesi strain H]OTN64941.1 Uncharacterized protein PKNOH_S120118600 [Plasmodium knowlesi]CAA9988054.1 Plasmodium exported protein, unknown function [Plasmodium knowlesi strain H]SBO19907.1 Plasmodium exported protein, unknown function [Plasmodium knowlesi strain H]SBO29058.1 Plasmodium exported protein, unknown function [Plasmodium knowlesi strain H]VVS77528.1 Plasmodium exported protein, unknown function [Plasmodium knowlesi strai
MTKGEQVISVNGAALEKFANDTITGIQSIIPKAIDWLKEFLGDKGGGSAGTYESVWQNPKVIIPITAFLLFVFFGTAFIIMSKYVLRKKKSNKSKKNLERISKYDSASQPHEEEAGDEPLMPQSINHVPVLYRQILQPQMPQQQMVHPGISQPSMVHGQMPQYHFQLQPIWQQSEHQRVQPKLYGQEHLKQERLLQEQLLQEQLLQEQLLEEQLQEEQYDDEQFEQRMQQEQLSKEKLRQERWLQEQLLREQYEQGQCDRELVRRSEKKGIGKIEGREEKYDNNRENERYESACRKGKRENKEGKDRGERKGGVTRKERNESSGNNYREGKYQGRTNYEYADLNQNTHYIGYNPIKK